MANDVLGDIEFIRTVQDSTGSKSTPANEDRQQDISDRLGNFASGEDGTQTSDGSVTTLPNVSVPDGVEVVIQAQNANTGIVYIGLTNNPVIELKAGASIQYKPANLSQVRIKANTGGDGVNYTFEAQ